MYVLFDRRKGMKKASQPCDILYCLVFFAMPITIIWNFRERDIKRASMDLVDVPIPLPAITRFGDLVALLPIKSINHSVRFYLESMYGIEASKVQERRVKWMVLIYGQSDAIFVPFSSHFDILKYA